MENVIVQLQNIRSTLPKQQKLLCDYICDHILEASMLTIADLAEKVGVGTATVTRMLYSLGYRSYSQFKSDLREQAFQQTNSSYDAFWNIHQDYNSNSSVEKDMFDGFKELHMMCQPLFFYQLQTAAQLILSAHKVYIIGLRSASPVSTFLEHSLREVRIDARSLSNESEYTYDRLLELDKGDLLIAIASRPIVKKTAEALEICYKRGIPTLLILMSNGHDILEDYATQTIHMQTEKRTLISTPMFLSAELLSREVSRLSSDEKQTYYKDLEKLLNDNSLCIWD